MLSVYLIILTHSLWSINWAQNPLRVHGVTQDYHNEYQAKWSPDSVR